MKSKVRFNLLAAAILSALLLASCNSENTPAVDDTGAPEVTSDTTAAESEAAQGETTGEKTVVFTSGTEFTGTKRIGGTYTGQYLSETPEGKAQDGKIVYTVNYSEAGSIKGTTSQTAGAGSTSVTAKASLGYKFVKWSDGLTDATRSGDTEAGVYTAIFDYDVLDMPVVVVNTDSGKAIASKTEYITASFSILGCDNAAYNMEPVVTEIRGRGNNSWGYPKKSYKFKLAEKTNIFGLANGDEKIWVLLANQCDQSLQRNHVAFELGRYFEGVDWEPNSTSVELYLNGEYVGVYLLAEDIKVSGDRVDIDDKNIDAADTGYLLELSNYASGEVIYAGFGSYMIHSDLSENASVKEGQREFITEYVDECWYALMDGDRETVEGLIDVDSLLACYLTEETLKNLDSQWDSFYLYKDAGGKLVFGPMWDFDLSLGNANEGAEQYTDIFVGSGRGSGGGITWFRLAMSQEWFRQLVADKWNEIYESISLMPQFIVDEGKLGLRSYERNFEKWKIFGTSQNRETYLITSLDSYEKHYEYLAEWLTNRIEWLNDCFNADTFVSQGTGVDVVDFSGWGNVGGGGGTQRVNYGNDETKELMDEYESLADYVNAKTITGPDGFGGEGVENLFDGDRDTKYCVDVNGECTVEWALKKAYEVKAYLLRTGNDTSAYTERNPDSWVFYGSEDSVNWNVISEEADGDSKMGTDDQIWYGFECQNPAAYKYYRIVFKNNGTMQLAEMRLLG